MRIDTSREFAQGIFGPQFQTLDGWLAYWSRRQNAVSPIFAKNATLWTHDDFQTLYIACWLHTPVEKGSYMIPLGNQARRATMRAAMGNLDTRWSSHLSEKNARSAGRGYNFLNGYSELLVQFEEIGAIPQLFLKTEGHGAFSIAHVKSFIHKTIHNEGKTASQLLHDEAVSGTSGIKPRAAENYDAAYQALLARLGMKGILHTVEEAVPAICRKLQQKTTIPTSIALTEVELAVFTGATMSKRLLAQVIREVIIATLDRPDLTRGKFVNKLLDARSTLETIARGLDADAGDIQTASVPRVFQEVRVTVEQLDQTVSDFVNAIHDWKVL